MPDTPEPTALLNRIADIATPFLANFSDEEAAKVNAKELAAAVLADLPEQTDRAAVYRDLADQQTQLAVADDLARRRDLAAARRQLVRELRRVAAEEQPAETHSCRNCEGADPDTCLTNPDRKRTPMDPVHILGIGAAPEQAVDEQPRITSDGGGVLLHLPEIVYIDTQAWAVDIGLNTDALRALRDAATAYLAGEQPAETKTQEPQKPPTEADIARAHVLAVHQIGEQLAGIETWMWEHLANVRSAAPEQPTVGEQPETQETPRCVCGDPVQLMDEADPTSWIHSPGSDTRCLDARPRCSHCQMPHDLTPSMALACASVRASIRDRQKPADYERTTGHLITCLAVAGGGSDPDCPSCQQSETKEAT